MHLTTIGRRRMLAGLAALAGIIGGSAQAQPPAAAPAAAPAVPPPPPPAEVKVDKATGSLIVPIGGAVRFDPKAGNKAIFDAFVRNEEILQTRYGPPDPRSIILIGRAPGLTQLTLTFEDKSQARFEVVVQPDFDLLRSVIKRTVPTANVDVVPGAGNAVVLTGFVTRPEDSDTVVRIASTFVGGVTQNVINAIQIGGAQHVLIDVTIAQVDRTELRERGFSFGVNGGTFGISSVVGGLVTSNVATNLFSGGAALAAPVLPGSNANIIAGIVPANTLLALRALRTEGVAKFLSEPKVTVQSGRPAFLRAGGQQAVLGPSSGINGPGVVLENVGTQLEVLPIVFGNGKIYLEVNPQFRSVNAGRGVTTAFGFTPGFNEQQTRSSILLESGQTYAIGGLLETSSQASAEKVPYLGDLPWIGFAFSNVRSEEREEELLILVTPRLVEALDCNQVPKRIPGKETRTADDYELFIESLIEAPRGQRKVWNGRTYNPAYRNSETNSLYPCVGGNCPGGVTSGMLVQGGYLATGPATQPALTIKPTPPVTPNPVQPAGGPAAGEPIPAPAVEPATAPTPAPVVVPVPQP